MTMKKNLFAALVALTAVAMTANSASAHLFGRGSHGSWGGGSGGSWGGSSGGSWGGSSGGSWGGSSGGSWGGGSRGSWGGGSRGSWGGGSYGSYGGGSCGSCGGYTVSYSSCGSCGGTVSYGGDSCSSCGGDYSSVSYGSGSYVVSSRSTTVVASSKPAVKTQLTLTVPAEAKVTLAGVETKQTGEVRTFATSKLASGEVWNDYKVVIEMNRDGQTVREERVIKLIGGQDQDLAINFDSNKSEQIAQLSSK